MIKANTGDDWIIPSVISIYPHVEAIVFVLSNVSWTGRKGNPCEKIIRRKILPFDYEKKIHILDFKDNTSQREQCNYGMRFIKEVFPWAERVMMVDTDEIWTDADLNAAKEWLKSTPKFIGGICSRMRSYIRSPFYRVNHLDPLTPMIFVPNCGYLKGDRGMESDPVILMDNVVMHHFVFVRRRFEMVLEKLINSHTVENQKFIALDYWLERVWFRLPNGTSKSEGLHPALGYQNNWKGVEQIGLKDLPEVLQKRGCFPIIEQFIDDATDFDGVYYPEVFE